MPDEIRVGACTVEVVYVDITSIAVDAIVNAANAMLAGGGGVDGAIHAAGGPTIMQELRQYNGSPTGTVVVTSAGKLPARFIFHAVGPVYRGGDWNEAHLLASCYRNALFLAQQYGCASISFPSISTGIYGYPIEAAASVALSAIVDTLPHTNCVRMVKLVQFSDKNFQTYQRLLSRHLSAQTG